MPYADPIKRKEFQKKYRLKNKEKLSEQEKQWRLKNKKHLSQVKKQWRLKNKLKLKLYYRKKRKTDENYRIANNLRSRIYSALKGMCKSANTSKLLGCSIEFLKKYLEKQFKPGMSWKQRNLIHIDHIKPCASFDLTDPKQQAICFHYTNLQPLLAIDNLKKGVKII